MSYVVLVQTADGERTLRVTTSSRLRLAMAARLRGTVSVGALGAGTFRGPTAQKAFPASARRRH